MKRILLAGLLAFALQSEVRGQKSELRPPPVDLCSPISTADAERIVNAIYRAEGGAKAKYPYGIIAPKKLSEAEARRWCLNTVRNNWKRWQVAQASLPAGSGSIPAPCSYLEFLANRYAPIGASNDPKNLNRNWLKNVNHFLAQ